MQHNDSLLTKQSKSLNKNFFKLALIVFCAGFFVFNSGLPAQASSASDYWKTYFSTEELKAVQKNAEKYTLAQIKNKSDQWRSVITGFNIKNGSVTNDDIASVDAGKVKNLADTIDQRISQNTTAQDFSADNLTGSYAALNGSGITGITASQVGAVPYTGATSNLDLGSRTLTTTSTGTFGNIKTPIISPATDSTSAFQINKADGITNVLNVDTTNGRVGIGTTTPLAKLHIGNGTINNSVDSQIIISRLVDNSVSGNGHAFSDSSNVSRGGTIGYASYDARINYSGLNNFDHYAAFQASPTYSSSGTISNVYGLYAKGTITSGTITNNYGIYADSPLYTAGTMTNNWGIYVAPQVAATNNYAAAFMGKVGIGNSTPAVALDVLGANPRMYLADNATGYSMLKMYSTVAGSALYLGHESNAGGAVLTGSAANSGVLLTGGAYPLQFGTNGALRMTIDGTSGNIGIGTTTPAAALDVNGQVKIQKSSAQPFACDATHDGTIALTSGYRTCVCKGGTTTWVFTTDGTTTCTW